ncbi:MAG: tyrosine-type recombinase/integrase [Hylemonella sp.]|nr:tyrosine-type recombinase/integrase [Hylemonella sp.]
MRIPAPTSIVLKPEQLRLVKRPDSKKWQVHYKIDGIKKWFRKTVDTAEIKEAKRLAERLWMKATFDHEEGRPIISKRFKPVAEVVLARLEEQIKAGTAKPSTRDYTAAIRIYLIPFYGNFNVDSIKPSTVSEFHEWRRNLVGRELSGSAQNNHNAAFNLVIDEAIERGYTTEYQRPATKNTGGDSDRRAEFSQEELETLIKFSNKFIEDGRTKRTKMIRELLGIYIAFMASTGMRPGTESEFIEWRHIDVEMRDGQPILHIRLQRGKRGPRNFVAHYSCWLLLERLRQLSPDLAKMSLEEVLKKRIAKRLFRLSDGTVPDNLNKPFRQMLEDCGLLNCPVTNKERSLYSLRHYYATQRLLEGIPIHDLAEQMGTSVKMITDHYSHLTPLMKAKQFAGVVDGVAGGEAAQIREIMQAQSVVNNNILSLVQMSTGLSMPLLVQSSELTKDFESRLKAKAKST